MEELALSLREERSDAVLKGFALLLILYASEKLLCESGSAYESVDSWKLPWGIYHILSNRICAMALCYCAGHRIGNRIANGLACIAQGFAEARQIFANGYYFFINRTSII
ncbi:hypothetical protein IMI45_10455 [Parageobacillus thermoglucosidasius]|uniref:Uncharacterized protein n=1 Tax=Parageobacillus thermoglucosidasius TaxID=1426 RepID=A0AB38QWF6_PARTM|nr:hypothetical protein IMI45_10455 [Parageobacillus thermoglucosidasius]